MRLNMFAGMSLALVLSLWGGKALSCHEKGHDEENCATIEFCTEVSCADELVVGTWPWTSDIAQLKSIEEVYKSGTGSEIKAEHRPTAFLGVVPMLARRSAAPWGLVETTGSEAAEICDKGLAKRVDWNRALPVGADGTKGADDFGEYMMSECFIPRGVDSMVLAYRSDLIRGTEPSNICEIFDSKRDSGKVALPLRTSSILEWALLCDGVEMGEVYKELATDEGQERALAAVDEVENKFLWVEGTGEVLELLAQGLAAKGVIFTSDVIAEAEKNRMPIEVLWDGHVLHVSGWVIPEQVTDVRYARALNYALYMLNREDLVAFPRDKGLALTRDSADLDVAGGGMDAGDIAMHLPTYLKSIGQALHFDHRFWDVHGSDIYGKLSSVTGVVIE